MTKTNSYSFFVVLADGIMEIPQSSNLSWLTLFYALPKELVVKRPEYLELPRDIHQLLQSEEYNTDFSDDTSLNVFRVTLDATILDILKKTNPDVYDAIIDGTSYTYNISLLKNGEETQPDGEVKVYVPIPDDLKLLAYAGKAKIFRVEEDGTLTEMDVEIEDSCFVFNTSHFSLYTLVGNTALQETTLFAIGGIIVISIFLLLLAIRKAKRRKKQK